MEINLSKSFIDGYNKVYDVPIFQYPGKGIEVNTMHYNSIITILDEKTIGIKYTLGQEMETKLNTVDRVFTYSITNSEYSYYAKVENLMQDTILLDCRNDIIKIIKKAKDAVSEKFNISNGTTFFVSPCSFLYEENIDLNQTYLIGKYSFSFYTPLQYKIFTANEF